MCDIEGNRFTAAVIIGHDDSIWAQWSAFPQFKPSEISAIMMDFEEPGSLAPTGLLVAGTKYMVIQGEAGAVIRGKVFCSSSSYLTTNMMIFGIYKEPLMPGQCHMVVERLMDCLIEQGL
ncbi:hypothetical protein MLD38_028922 [Melastoma candidum]|uniref:Uncharacterized protein n=1 Tax=Melastoma candidum TaxID=119954 RepID=A0ACB9N4P1_9MYRT|nr:hypothetical protein MLD38_028922 [Melastoma candidum]